MFIMCKVKILACVMCRVLHDLCLDLSMVDVQTCACLMSRLGMIGVKQICMSCVQICARVMLITVRIDSRRFAWPNSIALGPFNAPCAAHYSCATRKNITNHILGLRMYQVFRLKGLQGWLLEKSNHLILYIYIYIYIYIERDIDIPSMGFKMSCAWSIKHAIAALIVFYVKCTLCPV